MDILAGFDWWLLGILGAYLLIGSLLIHEAFEEMDGFNPHDGFYGGGF